VGGRRGDRGDREGMNEDSADGCEGRRHGDSGIRD
jgi:hypothetical protein